jgi:hypothetical protein
MSRAARSRSLAILLVAVATVGGVSRAAEDDGGATESAGPASTAAAPDLTLSPSPDAAVPFAARPFDLRELGLDELSWTGEAPPPLPPTRETDAAGIPMFKVDGDLHYRPGALAINGMKRIDAYRETGDRRHLDQALLHAAKLRELAILDREAIWLPFWFDYKPAKLKAPWFNAMSQGLALSFFVRLHAVTDDPVDQATADELFRSFTLFGPGRQPWVTFVDRAGYLWLEHYPNRRHDHHLNAHLHATLGLYEYWKATGSAEARHLLEGAITTLRDNAGRFRRPGRVSFYSSRTKTVIPSYHDIHIWQLRLLGRITGDAWFTRLGDDFATDHPPKPYVPGRPAVDGIRLAEPTAPLRLRLGVFPPTGPWSAGSA